MSELDEFGRKIREIYNNPGKGTDLFEEEFLTAVEVFWGEDVDLDTVVIVGCIEKAMRKAQQSAARKYESGGSKIDDYYREVQEIIKSSYKLIERVVGEDLYERLYGSPFGDEEGVLDRSQFISGQSANSDIYYSVHSGGDWIPEEILSLQTKQA